MAAEPQEPDGDPRDRLSRELGLADATFIVVASVIGAGIFVTPGRVAELLPHPGWILLAWLAGALLSLPGAIANAELAATFPRAGGDYVYLREAMHPVAGFLVGWLSFFAIYAGTIAALAVAFVSAACGGLGWSEPLLLGLAALLIVLVSAINAAGVRWGAHATNATSLAKLVALTLFVVLAFSLGEGDATRLLTSAAPADAAGEGAHFSWLAFGRAMSPVLFSYLGWNASVYVASEIRAPGRNVPLSLLIGLALCAAVYLALNLVYLYALPLDVLIASDNVGEAAAQALFGRRSGQLVAIFVGISILGTLSAMVLVGPRIAYAMALDGLFPAAANRVGSTRAAPIGAIALQALAAIAILFVLRSLPRALDFATFAIVLASVADVAALYLLRWRQPQRVRPYKAWGYPWFPALYLVGNVAVAVALILGSPVECAISVALLLAGLPFYFWLAKRRTSSRAAG